MLNKLKDFYVNEEGGETVEWVMVVTLVVVVAISAYQLLGTQTGINSNSLATQLQNAESIEG